jgi:hypothetical protein
MQINQYISIVNQTRYNIDNSIKPIKVPDFFKPVLIEFNKNQETASFSKSMNEQIQEKSNDFIMVHRSYRLDLSIEQVAENDIKIVNLIQNLDLKKISLAK